MTYLALELSQLRQRRGQAPRRGLAPHVPGFPDRCHHQRRARGDLDAPPVAALFDRHIPGWREDNASLRYACGIPLDELWQAHQRAKQALIRGQRSAPARRSTSTCFTIGFARRATAYKRADLLFRRRSAAAPAATRGAGLQIVYAGKAHPHDDGGKELIRRMFADGAALGGEVPVVYVAELRHGRSASA